MTDKKNLTDEAGASDAQALKLSRRKMLKLGAASAPVVISLQSGTAWAASVTCEKRVIFPTAPGPNDQELMDLLADDQLLSYNANTATQAEIERLFALPNYQMDNEGHQAFLRAEVTSCWASIEYRSDI